MAKRSPKWGQAALQTGALLMGRARKPSLDPWGCASRCPPNMLLNDWPIAPDGLFRQCSRYYTDALHVEKCPKRTSCKPFLLYSSLTDLYPVQGAFPRSRGLSSKPHWSRTVRIPSSTVSSCLHPRVGYHPSCKVFKGFVVFL